MSDARLGLIFAIISSIGLGLRDRRWSVAFERDSRLAVAMTRCWFGATLVAIYLKARHLHLYMPRAFRIHVVILGPLVVQMTWGGVTSVAYIPVGLAALLFFVCPPLVAVFVAVLDRRPPRLIKVARRSARHSLASRCWACSSRAGGCGAVGAGGLGPARGVRDERGLGLHRGSLPGSSTPCPSSSG